MSASDTTNRCGTPLWAVRLKRESTYTLPLQCQACRSRTALQTHACIRSRARYSAAARAASEKRRANLAAVQLCHALLHRVQARLDAADACNTTRVGGAARTADARTLNGDNVAAGNRTQRSKARVDLRGSGRAQLMISIRQRGATHRAIDDLLALLVVVRNHDCAGAAAALSDKARWIERYRHETRHAGSPRRIRASYP